MCKLARNSLLLLALLGLAVSVPGLSRAAPGQIAAQHAMTPVQDAPMAVTAYFPVLPYNAEGNAVPELVPVASNHPLDGDHGGIRRAIIVIHDQTRDAGATLATMTTLAGTANRGTIILAPQFLLDADIERYAGQLPDGGSMFARWQLTAAGGWDSGGDSMILGPQKGISSFTVIDLMLLYLADRKLFPDLQDIVIAGHGRGADFTQRYAALGQAPALLDTVPLPVRFIVANASSYLYVTATRPKAGNQGLGSPDVTQCPDFNAYKFGLDQMNAYARRVGASAIKLNYVTRRVTYLNGAKAVSDDAALDTGCAAMLEGPDRLSRAALYRMYLGITYGDTISRVQQFVMVPDIGYDASGLMGSRCGMAVLFGDGACDNTAPIMVQSPAPTPLRKPEPPQNALSKDQSATDNHP